MESVWKAVKYKNTDFYRFLSYQLSNNLFNTVFLAAARRPVGFPPNEQLYYYYY